MNIWCLRYGRQHIKRSRIVTSCHSYFFYSLRSKKRQDKFILRYISTVNVFLNFAASCSTYISSVLRRAVGRCEWRESGEARLTHGQMSRCSAFMADWWMVRASNGLTSERLKRRTGRPPCLVPLDGLSNDDIIATETETRRRQPRTEKYLPNWNLHDIIGRPDVAFSSRASCWP